MKIIADSGGSWIWQVGGRWGAIAKHGYQLFVALYVVVSIGMATGGLWGQGIQ